MSFQFELKCLSINQKTYVITIAYYNFAIPKKNGTRQMWYCRMKSSCFTQKMKVIHEKELIVQLYHCRFSSEV